MEEKQHEYFVNTGGPCLMLFQCLGGRKKSTKPMAILDNMTRVKAIEATTYKWRGFTRWMLVEVVDSPIRGWVAAMYLTRVEAA